MNPAEPSAVVGYTYIGHTVSPKHYISLVWTLHFLSGLYITQRFNQEELELKLL